VTVLRRGYVPVEPDASGFDEKLAADMKKQDPGGKAGKQIGGQLNRALKRLDLDPIDVKADPKKAFAAIEATEAKLKELGRDSATVEVKIQTEKALSQLGRFKKQLGDVGEGSGPDAAGGFIRGFVSKLGTSLPGAFSGSMASAAAPALLALTPTLAAGIAGAVIGGAAIGGVVGGITLAARDPRVKEAGGDLGRFLLADLGRRASGFVQPVLGAIEQIRAGFADMGPDLDRIFNSSRFVAPLTDGLIQGTKGFVSGLADAVDQADPVIYSLRNLLVSVGGATGDLFRNLSQDADEGASAIDDLTLAITNMVSVTGQILHTAASIQGLSTDIDKVVDKTRYWVEDNSALNDNLKLLGVSLDITADGFKKGSVEAEAYRKATLGTATANDFATLKQAGMSDAQIASADASGKYRAEIDKTAQSTRISAAAAGTLVAVEEDVAAIQKEATLVQQQYTKSIELMAPKAQRASMLIDGVKKATQLLYGAQEQQIDANEAYEASWDSLSESVKANKGSLDAHTKSGRANRDALQALLSSNRDLYYADINSGVATDKAKAAHDRRTEAVRKEAARVGLNKKETDALIKSYGRIPPDKTTKIIQSGVDKVVKAMMDLYIYQRSLAEGLPIGTVRAMLKNESGPAKRYGGYHDGGYTGAGAEHEPAGVVHRDEFVIKKSSRQKIEARNPGLLAEMNATGQLPGYSAGGWVGGFPVDPRDYHVAVTGRNTKIPSRLQVASKVQYAMGHWPSSPSAQRGDSGVWRKVVALIKSTGPLSGSFGNAYRPGDPLWHGSGRAVDWMGYNQDALASFLAARKPLELIHRTAKRDYAYTRGVNKGSFNESLMEAHRNHVHIAMDDGGVRVLQPGMNLIPNGTGRPEPIAGPAAMAELGGRTYNVTVNVPVGAHPAETGRQLVLAIQSFEQSNGSRWRDG
jgi:hypothetical protein